MKRFNQKLTQLFSSTNFYDKSMIDARLFQGIQTLDSVDSAVRTLGNLRVSSH